MEFERKLDGLQTVLPPRFQDGLIPDLEHTILFPVSTLTWASTATAFVLNKKAGSRHSVVALIASFALAALPSYQIVRSAGMDALDRKGLGISVTNSVIATALVAAVNLWTSDE